MRITDIRKMFPSDYICHADLIDDNGKRRVLRAVIDHVEQKKVVSDQGLTGQKWVLFFRPTHSGYQPKPLVLNVTNTIAIASVHGPPTATADINQLWGGKEIELYIGSTRSVAKWRPVYGATMPAIRIRGRSSGAEEMKEELRSKSEATPDYDKPPEGRQPGDD